MNATLARRLAAEALGTALLLAVVVGSGVMGQTLAPDQDALALLGNTLATGAALVVLITVFEPISGAHFNPVVTTVMALRRQVEPNAAILYVAAQVLGALVGVVLAHAMFGQALVQVSTHARDGGSQVLSEAVATFGLMATVLGVSRVKPEATATCVGLYITAAYWFTASTSFANPAVTLALAVFDWMFKQESAA